MKSTKTLWITLLAACGLLAPGLSLRAQDSSNAAPPTGTQRARGARGFDRMAQALNLTDEQKPRVRKALEKMHRQMRDLRQDSSLSRKDRRAKVKTIRESTDAKLKEILTADQYKKWQDLRSRMRHRRNGRPRGDENSVPNTPATPPQS